MITRALLTLALGSPPGTVAAFDPDSATVYADEDSVELLAFDVHGTLIGAVLLTTVVGRLELAANYSDGYAEIVLARGDRPPEPELVDLNQLCGTGGSTEISAWIATDLPDPCEGVERIVKVFAVAEPALLELDVRAPYAEHKPGVRECMLRFAVAGTICGFSIIFPNPGLAIGCVAGVFEGACSCAEHLRIPICRW